MDSRPSVAPCGSLSNRRGSGLAGPGLSGARRSRSSVPCLDFGDALNHTHGIKVETAIPADASSDKSRASPASCEVSQTTRLASSLCDPSLSVCAHPQLQLAADVPAFGYYPCQTSTCSVDVCRVVQGVVDRENAFGEPFETGSASMLQHDWLATSASPLACSILPDCNDAGHEFPLLCWDSDGPSTPGLADAGENWAATPVCVALATRANSSEGRPAAELVCPLPAAASEVRAEGGAFCLPEEAPFFGADLPFCGSGATSPFNDSSWTTCAAWSPDLYGCAPAPDHCDSVWPPMQHADLPSFGEMLYGPSSFLCSQPRSTDGSAGEPDAIQGLPPVGPLPTDLQGDMSGLGTPPLASATPPQSCSMRPGEGLCGGRDAGCRATGGPAEGGPQVGPRAAGAGPGPSRRGRPRRHNLALISEGEGGPEGGQACGCAAEAGVQLPAGESKAPRQKKQRGPKPKYLYVNQEEALAMRRLRNRKTALSSYYKRKARLDFLAQEVEGLTVEHEALVTLLACAGTSPHVAGRIGELLYHGASPTDVAQNVASIPPSN